MHVCVFLLLLLIVFLQCEWFDCASEMELYITDQLKLNV